MEKIIEYLHTIENLLKITDLGITDCDAVENLLKQSLARFQTLRKKRAWGVAKKVKCITTGQEFHSLSDAAYYFSVRSQDIYQSINIGSKVKKRYEFIYVREEDDKQREDNL